MVRSLSHTISVLLCVAGVNLAPLELGAQLFEPKQAPSRLLPLEIAWTVALPAAAATAPVAARGRVFVALHESWGGDKVIAVPTGHIAALSLVDGSQLWQVPEDVATALAVGDGTLYVASGAELRGRDITSGAIRWSIQLDSPLSAPLVWNSGWLIVALASDELLALRADTGEVIWRKRLNGQIRSSPALAGSQLYVSLDTGAVISLSLLSGESQWERKLEGEPQEILPVGDLFVGSTDNYFYALTAGDGSIRWRWQAGGDIVGRPFVDDERVYFSSLDNVLWALNRSNGVQRWRQPLPVRPTSGPNKLQDLLVQGGRSAGVSFFDPITGTRYGAASAPAELSFPPLILSDLSDDGPLLILTAGDGQLQAISSATGPARLGLAAIRHFGKELTNHYPFGLPRLSPLEISSFAYQPCFFHLCEPLAGTALSPCMFQECEPAASSLLMSEANSLTAEGDPELASTESTGVDNLPLGLSLRWSSLEDNVNTAPTVTEASPIAVSPDEPTEYAVLAALANHVTARWLVSRLIDQGYSAFVLDATEDETRPPYWVYVGAHSTFPAAEAVGGKIERDHLVDWYVVRLLGRRPTSWVW